MENIKLRENLHQKIENIKSNSQLELLNEIINEITSNESSGDFSENLSVKEKKSIYDGLNSIANNDTVPNEEVVNKFLK